MPTATAANSLWIEFTYDEYSAASGYDGDIPLDENKSWTPYIASLVTYDGNGDEDIIDSIGAIWTTDDSEGRESAIEAALHYLCPKDVTPEDIEITGI